MTRARWVDPDAQFVLDEAQPMTDQALEVLSEAPPAAPRRPRPARRFFLALGVLVIALVGFELYGFIAERFQQHWAIGAGFTALVAAVEIGRASCRERVGPY